MRVDRRRQASTLDRQSSVAPTTGCPAKHGGCVSNPGSSQELLAIEVLKNRAIIHRSAATTAFGQKRQTCGDNLQVAYLQRDVSQPCLVSLPYLALCYMSICPQAEQFLD